jgi:acyl carrier protein
MPSVDGRLREVFLNLFDVPREKCVDSLSVKDVESWDSVKHIALVLALEECFGVEFSPDEMSELVSVGKIRAMLAERGVQ